MTYGLGYTGVYTGGSVENTAGYQEFKRRQYAQQHEERLARAGERQKKREAATQNTNSSSAVWIPEPVEVDPVEAERQRKIEEARHKAWLKKQEAIRLAEEKRKKERLEVLSRMSRKQKVLHFLWITSPIYIMLCAFNSLLEKATAEKDKLGTNLNRSVEIQFGIKKVQAVLTPIKNLVNRLIPAVTWKVVSSVLGIVAFGGVLKLGGGLVFAVPAAVLGFYLLKICRYFTYAVSVYLLALAYHLGSKLEEFIWWAEEATGRVVEKVQAVMLALLKLTLFIAIFGFIAGLIMLVAKLQ
ncbi:hypothetical protein [Gimesia sp.]|uniref:hypothetical protein n=1 Tax=Gimesia sp. TaxID=2024833 RepID=UPI003A92E0F2